MIFGATHEDPDPSRAPVLLRALAAIGHVAARTIRERNAPIHATGMVKLGRTKKWRTKKCLHKPHPRATPPCSRSPPS